MKFWNKLLTVASYVAFYPIVGILYLTMQYSLHINGVEPKTGQQYYHYKTENGKSYYKKEGLKNILTRWKECKTSKTFGDNDIASLYPSVISNGII